MDHGWNQLNQQFNQQYQRLAAAASNSVAGNARFDIPQALLEQTAALATPGLSALSPPLPAHTLQGSRIGVGTLPAMNYPPTLPVGMGLESLSAVNSLGTSFTTQSPYTKSVPQPAFSLDGSSHADMARHLANSGSSLSRSESLSTHTPSSSSVYSAVDSPKSWGLSQYLPGQTGQYMPVNANTSSPDYTTGHVDPPPAHSGSVGSRQSAIQRNPFTQSSVSSREALLMRETLQVQEEQRLKRALNAKHDPPHAHASSNRLGLSHQTYASSSSSSSKSLHSSGSSSSAHPPPPPAPPSVSSAHYSSSSQQHLTSHQATANLLSRASSNSDVLRSSSSSYRSSPQITSSSLQHSSNYSSYSSSSGGGTAMTTYEAVSPAAPAHSASEHFDTNIALHGLADISSNREKLPLQEKHVSHHSTAQHGQVGMRMQDMSPPMATNLQQQQSPISTGSPHVPLSTMAGSPQAHVPSSSVPPAAHMPVQAVPDSTTKPKRKRAPKKKEKPAEPPPPPISSVSQQTVIAGQSQYEQQPMTQNYVNTLPHGYDQQHVVLSSAENMAAVHSQYFSQMVAGMEAMEQQSGSGGGGGGGSEEQPVFMTNAFGSAFVNPNDAMGLQSSDNQSELYDENSSNRNKLRTKAEQKMPPVATSVQDDFDDEFAHLAKPPDETKVVKKSPPRFTPLGNPISPPRNPSSQLGNANSLQPNSTDVKPVVPTPPPKKDPGFQTSFMSFLQGKKPETLSSVTNQAITKRPPMPVYIPDPRPRRVEESKAKPRLQSSGSDFSDLDDEDAISKTVQNVISNLSDDGSGSSSNPPKVPPITISIKGLAKTRARGGGPAIVKSQRSSSSSSSKSSKANRSMSYRGGSSKKVVVLDSDEEGAVRGKGRESAAVVPRERVSRRAKEKVEEKRKAKIEKKRKGSKVSDDDSDYDVESDFDEAAYDSDKDPSWCPGEGPPVPKRINSSDDDEPTRHKKMRLNPSTIMRKGSMSKSGRGFESGVMPGSEPSYDANGEPSPHSFMRGDFVMDKKDLSNPDSFPIWRIDAGRLLQKFEPVIKDSVVVAHKALSTYSSWSEDIRKQYKGVDVKIVSQGRGADVVEVLEEYRPKATEAPPPSAQSAPAPAPAPAPSAPVPAQPPPPQQQQHQAEVHGNNTLSEDEALLTSFNVYMQIVVSQALEPGFLSAITQEKDDYYFGPLEHIDSLLHQAKLRFQQTFRWNPHFQAAGDAYPYYKVADRPAPPPGIPQPPCQACTSCGRAMEKSVQLMGGAYSRDTLELQGTEAMEPREYGVCPAAVQQLHQYHKLHHFKFTLYRNCLRKVEEIRESVQGIDMREILDACLQNRGWVNGLYTDLLKLISHGTR